MGNEWDNNKNEANIFKHGLSFDEAATALDDPLSVTVADVRHSTDEDRFLTTGVTTRGRLVVVSFTERGANLRIISARLASSYEKRTYEYENN